MKTKKIKTFEFQGIKFKVSSLSNVDPVPFCVGVGRTKDGNFAVRHSQDSDPAKTLVFTEAEWNAFVKGVKANEFDV